MTTTYKSIERPRHPNNNKKKCGLGILMIEC